MQKYYNWKNGEVRITATIDSHSMTITEGSLRRHLKLDDQDGISSIPNSEIFETRSCSSPTLLDVTEPSLTLKNHILTFHSPFTFTSLHIHLQLQFQTSPNLTLSLATPTQPLLGAEHHLLTPNESPLYAVHSHRSDEGRLKLNELTYLVTKLCDTIGVLEVKTGESKEESLSVHSDNEALQMILPTQGTSNTRSEAVSKECVKLVLMVQRNRRSEDEKGKEKDQGKKSLYDRTKSYAEAIYKEDRFDDPSVIGEVAVTQEEVKKFPKSLREKRKNSYSRKSSRKRQKLEDDAEKEELKGFLDIIPREEVPMDVESLSTNSRIQSIECDALTKTFDRQDVKRIVYRIVHGKGIALTLLKREYPLSQEMISKMLKKKLEVDHESSQAFELLRFIRSQVRK
ncbi:hypothetical protein Tco_0553778 [Tanacetum coccineum]